jgi:hypothetical protein
MNIMRYCFLLVSLLIAEFVGAQTIHTDVLVTGATESGVAAAIQAAHSGVKVLLIVETNDLAGNITQNRDTTFDAGIQANFLKLTLKARTDSTLKIVNPFSQAVASDVLKGWTDTIKNLTIMRNTTFQKIEKSRKDWEVKLNDGKTIKADVVVDASANGALAAKAGIPFDQATGYYKRAILLNQPAIEHIYDNRLYRTSVGIGNSANKDFTIPLGSLVAAGAENFILAGRFPALKSAKQLEPATMSDGQAAGATAAFCSFFKTTTNSLNARVIQGELFAYKSWLIPFIDIQKTDSNFAAIQRIGVTGLLKGRIINGKLFFQPDSLVSGEELRMPMREFYSRSQIWFADHNIDKFTLNDVLSLIKFNASRGEELNKEVEKVWKTSFKFTGKYNLDHLVSRREFAVLADAYLKPFNVRVDINGNLGN